MNRNHFLSAGGLRAQHSSTMSQDSHIATVTTSKFHCCPSRWVSYPMSCLVRSFSRVDQTCVKSHHPKTILTRDPPVSSTLYQKESYPMHQCLVIKYQQTKNGTNVFFSCSHCDSTSAKCKRLQNKYWQLGPCCTTFLLMKKYSNIHPPRFGRLSVN